ncbi:MAG TPA: DUF4364 family protein [Candidatus Merdiplasma excrementigallinarum]|uniref:DUF4364 family protein n=1 Tax=Candidatus Merdiplasma excrementigallinarum TaxID=2840864 RepID=A0A9D1NXK2_9FIRM|nr:DUF4364 family protein [Candidatus Merdiplasma excrementigallinarum]
MSDFNTLYKLMILYMLSKVDFSLTNAQFSSFFLDKGYTDYFTVQSVLSELTASDLIHQEVVQNTSYYTITPGGEETVGYFKNNISSSIRSDIDEYLKANRIQLRNEVSVLADYYKNTGGDISVRCRVKEKQSDLIDLTITVPDETQAKAICRQWQKKCQTVYEFIMRELMQ